MIEADSPLTRLVGRELAAPAPESALALARAIREERGDLSSILFYGSCLRRKSDEGIFDFYVLVDRYRDTYQKTWLAVGNAILPPNVFYIETEHAGVTLRAKYAVLSVADFEAAVQPRCIHPYIWARFAQPSVVVYARDDDARAAAARCGAQAIVTLIQRLMVFLPASQRSQRFSLSALWQRAFAMTYGAERRAESDDHISGIYDSAPERYDEAAVHAFEELKRVGWIERASARGGGQAYEIEMSPMRRGWMRWRWQLSRPVARTLAIMRLLKTAFTFGDWVTYAIFKLERHTGEPIELTPRQRRHPLIFGWPVIWRVYLRR
ncbi:MAG: hypothetical protein QF570_14935 [Myxococcota bacterium]|jgi:hypothetical protein|nr:hypothetical protein [Myxococcota bacterium]